mmetsp:Transcript_21957/g.64889  ORF Transcript_21957/g.64889 Transcript_21957/m.64889 type:complete len:203 (+) Transcript_21957:181-789(+)
MAWAISEIAEADRSYEAATRDRPEERSSRAVMALAAFREKSPRRRGTRTALGPFRACACACACVSLASAPSPSSSSSSSRSAPHPTSTCAPSPPSFTILWSNPALLTSKPSGSKRRRVLHIPPSPGLSMRGLATATLRLEEAGEERIRATASLIPDTSRKSIMISSTRCGGGSSSSSSSPSSSDALSRTCSSAKRQMASTWS